MALEADQNSSSRNSSQEIGKPNFTPATSTIESNLADLYPPTIAGGDAWDGHCFPAVPWPGNVYLIIEKASGRPIVHDSNGRVALGDTEETSTMPAKSQWLCVEGNNHIGFQNPETGCYISHDDDDHMHATAPHFQDWEYVIARPHPKGGYQLLSQYDLEKLKLYVVGKDGMSLVRRMHGITLFEFKKL